MSSSAMPSSSISTSSTYVCSVSALTFRNHAACGGRGGGERGRGGEGGGGERGGRGEGVRGCVSVSTGWRCTSDVYRWVCSNLHKEEVLCKGGVGESECLGKGHDKDDNGGGVWWRGCGLLHPWRARMAQQINNIIIPGLPGQMDCAPRYQCISSRTPRSVFFGRDCWP